MSSGEVAADLLKPLGYFRYWLAVDLGRALVAFLLRGVTVMVVYALFFDITVPHAVSQWLALILAPLVGVGVLLVALQIWRFGLRHYQSTGT